MLRTLVGFAMVLVAAFWTAPASPQPEPAKPESAKPESAKPTRPPREGLQAVGELVGSWRGTGVPIGSREDQNKNFWVETIACEWKFKSGDAWLVLAFDKSKDYKNGELRYLPDKKRYQLSLKAIDDKPLAMSGELKFDLDANGNPTNKILTLESEDRGQRLVFTLLHDNRFLYRKEIRPEGKTSYTKVFQVGATKEGVPFAAGSNVPECIVTGGLGTMAVTYQGKSYFVCCSGCRDEFNANPAMYVKEFEAKMAKK
jgi:hypothetical protein